MRGRRQLGQRSLLKRIAGPPAIFFLNTLIDLVNFAITNDDFEKSKLCYLLI